MTDSLAQTILDSLPDGLLVVGANQRLRYANSSASRLAGFDVARLSGEDIDLVFWAIALEAIDGEAAFGSWQQAAPRLERRPALHLSFPSPSPRHLVARVFEISVPGGPADFGIKLYDITAERASHRARVEAIAMIGHELASPATTLVSLADVLAAGQQPEPERRKIQALILAEGHRLINLVHDLQAIPAVERNPFEVVRRLVDPRRLLEHALAVATATRATHDLSLDVPDALPPVNADPARVQQVLTNLLSNAQNYCPHGGQVTLSARLLGDTVEVSVADTGLGIPLSARGRVFEKFYRIDSYERRLISGTGLGLAICKEIVEAHGGEVGFDSAGPGQGSRFWFTLPVAPAQTRPIREPAADLEPRGALAWTGGLRVLVVDDDRAIGKMVRRILQADAHRVVAVTSGELAIERMREDRFDVVLSDLGIGPGIDGLELCTLVRASWPGVRFVLATGSNAVDSEDLNALGVDGLLAKPFRRAELRQVIRARTARLTTAQAA